jgi:type II secretory pathway pseudopilin PulG
MNPRPTSRKGAFSLIETVIAIGVLAVLLTGFLLVFTPAAAGIRKSISVQEADRLTSTLERELVTPRASDPTPGFNKAFEWLGDCDEAASALLVYQYRGSLDSTRTDGTPEPVSDVSSNRAGADYHVVPMVRRRSDPLFMRDIEALEGGVYLVKCVQLVYNNGELVAGTPGVISNPKTGGAGVGSADDYPDAVIAFAAEFHILPGRTPGYFDSAFANTFASVKNPVFTRNLAVRR